MLLYICCGCFCPPAAAAAAAAAAAPAAAAAAAVAAAPTAKELTEWGGGNDRQSNTRSRTAHSENLWPKCRPTHFRIHERTTMYTVYCIHNKTSPVF